MLLSLAVITKQSTYVVPTTTLAGTPQKQFSWLTASPNCISESVQADSSQFSQLAHATAQAFADNRCIQRVDLTLTSYSSAFFLACYGDNATVPANYQMLKYAGIASRKCVPNAVDVCPLLCENGGPINLKQILNELVFADVVSIKNAVEKYGVLLAKMNIFEDFYSHKDGVYEHRAGQLVGVQEIAIVGFGDDFWLVRTSEGSNFAENGFLRVRIGQEALGIEARCTAFEVA
ncbi:Cathepsin B [Spironucleus salmonicida]|uniref:Cathepsin B n=1 Tax=Spironucleus salmonicida TaxID=348837 RepID=V6M1J6_9EUKA|nr:Cathepsin B [Spironucleus salmonicida]|eukprot:EST47064.1 Cathepsin B [Spironucleus salmonicida]